MCEEQKKVTKAVTKTEPEASDLESRAGVRCSGTAVEPPGDYFVLVTVGGVDQVSSSQFQR